eukprot:maker-scaffold_15-snap-gene-1.33-mRNA-1 protein AED:0.23 eAED:0.23 QI:66/1/1/1/0/0/2/249/703
MKNENRVPSICSGDDHGVSAGLSVAASLDEDVEGQTEVLSQNYDCRSRSTSQGSSFSYAETNRTFQSFRQFDFDEASLKSYHHQHPQHPQDANQVPVVFPENLQRISNSSEFPNLQQAKFNYKQAKGGRRTRNSDLGVSISDSHSEQVKETSQGEKVSHAVLPDERHPPRAEILSPVHSQPPSASFSNAKFNQTGFQQRSPSFANVAMSGTRSANQNSTTNPPLQNSHYLEAARRSQAQSQRERKSAQYERRGFAPENRRKSQENSYIYTQQVPQQQQGLNRNRMASPPVQGYVNGGPQGYGQMMGYGNSVMYNPAHSQYYQSVSSGLDLSQRRCGRRGLSHLQVQAQSHYLVIVQRLFLAAEKIGIPPQKLYEAQMKRYMASSLASNVTFHNLGTQVEKSGLQAIHGMKFEMPGMYPLDERSYALVDLFTRYPHLYKVNILRNADRKIIDSGLYFVAICENELDIYRCIKYEYFSVGSVVDKLIKEHVRNFELETEDKGGLKKAFIYFLFEKAKRCVGLAEILGTTPRVVKNEKVVNRARLQLKWLFIKDVGSGILRQANDFSKKPTFAQENIFEKYGSSKMNGNLYRTSSCRVGRIEQHIGAAAFKRLQSYHSPNTLLLDFKMFEDAEQNDDLMPSYYKWINNRFTFKKTGNKYRLDNRSVISRSSKASHKSYRSQKSHKSQKSQKSYKSVASKETLTSKS